MDTYGDTSTDIQIKTCIDNQQNFTVIAGAGSGKTGSLIKGLVYVRQKRSKALRSNGQQIACITYTNAAVDVIKQRTDLDELFFISTIHSFLWSLIKSYQRDIGNILVKDLIPQRIAKQAEKDDGSQNKTAIQARVKIEKLKVDIENVSKLQQFSYDDSGRRDYSTGHLDHDDVIEIASIMIEKYPVLQKIIGHKFPYIFIDEAQDTFINVMKSLNLVAQIDGLPMIGYFGDPMQQIYDNRAGEFEGPQGAVVITKKENYRCSKEVIKLLNAIRPNLLQVPALDNTTGSVEIRLIQAEKGEGKRNTYSLEQISRALIQFDKALVHFGWSESDEVKQLFLTWQMIAHRLGFSNLNRLFTGRYASQTAQDSFRKGTHFATQAFMDVLIPIVDAYTKDGLVTMTRILRKYSPILDPKGVNEFVSVKEVKDKLQNAIDTLVSVWSDSSIREILLIACELGLVNVSEHLAGHLERSPRTEIYDENKYSLEKEDWLMDEFLNYKTNELMSYRNFILELTPFGTQHGAKGEEFEKVLVVFDDTEANWNNFSFSRLLTPNTVGKEPTDGQRKRSLNLAYVCFSRAIRDLRIILFTENPLNAKAELLEKKLFVDDQISIQS